MSVKIFLPKYCRIENKTQINGGVEGAFIVDAYPVSVEWTDIGLILFTVLTVGFIIAWYPVRQLRAE